MLFKKLLFLEVQKGLGYIPLSGIQSFKLSPISFHKHKKKGKATRECNKETFVSTFHFPASFVLLLV